MQKNSLIDSVGGIEGPYIHKLNKMIAGENIRYDKNMNWIKIDSLSQYPGVNQKIDELADVDAKIGIFGWIPWI